MVLRMATRLQFSSGDGVVISLCGRQIVVEKVRKDDSKMVRRAARRDVVFFKLLEMTLSRFTLV